MDDQARFRALFDAASTAVRRYAHHLGLNDSDAEDLAADVFTVAWRRLDAVPRDDAIPWLLAVARNHWRNHLRRTARALNLRQKLRGRPQSTCVEPELNDQSELWHALQCLSARDREILLLIAWDDLSTQQAAVVIGCSAATARVRLHRARNRLALAMSSSETNTSAPTVMGVEQE